MDKKTIDMIVKQRKIAEKQSDRLRAKGDFIAAEMRLMAHNLLVANIYRIEEDIKRKNQPLALKMKIWPK